MELTGNPETLAMKSLLHHSVPQLCNATEATSSLCSSGHEGAVAQTHDDSRSGLGLSWVVLAQSRNNTTLIHKKAQPGESQK